MSIFGIPTAAPKPQSKESVSMATLYAALLVVMVVAQLFTFEAFLALLGSFGLPGGEVTGYVLGSVLVAAQVFTLPFLLRMTISPAFRWFSLICGGLVADIWLFLTIWVAVTGPAISSIGFLGDVVALEPGLWTIFIAVAFGILALWATWGLWPGLFKRKAAKKSRKK